MSNTSSEPSGIHHMPSLVIAVFSAFAAIVAFTIVIPTSEPYAHLLGGDNAFSGLNIAVTCLVCALMGPVYQPIFNRWGLKVCFVAMASLGIVGNVLYALG